MWRIGATDQLTNLTMTTPSIYLVAIGRRWEPTKGEVHYHFRHIPSPDATIEPETPIVILSLKKKGMTAALGGRPGIIYKVEGDGATVYPSTAIPVGRYDDDARLTEWRMLDLMASRAKEASKSDGLSADLRKDLEPIRRAYMGLRTRQERARLLAEVIDLITVRL